MNTETLGQWLKTAIARLDNAGLTDSSTLDAQLLAMHGLKASRTRIIAFPETPLTAADITSLNTLLERRLAHEPIAYITGIREFWSTELTVDSDTLVPRADTEILVEKALELIEQTPQGPIVDLGTGSGAIAIAMAKELPQRQIIAVEKHQETLLTARQNINTHTQGNVALLQASWLDALAESSVAMVLSNPPYLASDDAHLPTLTYEPLHALVSGTSGLEDIRQLIIDTVRAAIPYAPLILEHGSEQGAAVRQLFLDYSYTQVGTTRDLAGHERISFGITPH